MYLRLSMMVSLLLFAFTTACTQAPPPDTHAADVQALKDTEAASAKAVAAKDFEKSMSYYADDASVLVPTAPEINGKDAIRAAFKPPQPISVLSLFLRALCDSLFLALFPPPDSLSPSAPARTEPQQRPPH